MPSSPRTVRAPSDEQMERLAVYSAFLARQVPKSAVPRSGRRMEGLLIRKPLRYVSSELANVQTYVFQDNQFVLRSPSGDVVSSRELAQDTLKNFYIAGTRTDDLFGSDEFSGPFMVFSGEELNARFQMESCHRPELCGLRLINQVYPNSGGLWGFSHIGFSKDHLQALVYYSDGYWGETGVALLEKGAGGCVDCGKGAPECVVVDRVHGFHFSSRRGSCG